MKLNKMFFVFLFYFDCIQQSVEMQKENMHEMEKRTSCVENKVIIIRAVDEGNRMKTCKVNI